MKNIRKILEPWPRRKDIVYAIQINHRLIKEGVSWEEVEQWIKQNPILSSSEVRQSDAKLTKKLSKPLCPKCGKKLNGSNLYPESDKYKEGWRSYWLCGASCCEGKGCGYKRFLKKTVEEVYGKED